MNLDGSDRSLFLSEPGYDDVFTRRFFFPDSDQDGAFDPCDNCRSVFNPDQANSDSDGLGDACDPDDDNDGHLDGADNCPLVSNPDQLNTDGDAQGNACDLDDDNDGSSDVGDNCPLMVNRPRIAFESQRGGNSDIYSMNSDGTGETRLTDGGAREYAPAFSRDGRRIAYARANTTGSSPSVWIMNANGTGQTNLITTGGGNGNPAFNHDGSKIAFNSSRDGNPEIYVMNSDGTSQTRLTNNPADDYQPTFSPDGTKIVFSSNRIHNDNEELYVMNIDGTNLIRLTTSPTRNDAEPTFSPDGLKIAFTSHDYGANDRDIYIINADGTGSTNLTADNTSYDSGPDFSRDGRIAYRASSSGDFEIFVMNADGSNRTQITNNSFHDLEMSWAPQPDADGDGVGDACDNCAVPNPGQQDADNDGIGDACDDDFDVATPAGPGVSIAAPNATVTFSTVATGGTTSFAPITVDPDEMPSGYALCPTCPAFDITTTATYSPPVTACIAVPASVVQPVFLRLALLHGENGAYVDRTTSRFTDPNGTRFVCGVVESLSPFALAVHLGPTAASVSVAGRVSQKDGRGIPKALITLIGPDGERRTVLSNVFGYYRFENVRVGESYVMTISSKRYVFVPDTHVIMLMDEVSDVDWVASPL